jgi:hypothetical protein
LWDIKPLIAKNVLPEQAQAQSRPQRKAYDAGDKNIMCIGNEIIKNQMSAEKNHNAAREIKQCAENPDTFKTGNAVHSGTSCYRANKEGYEYV